MKFMVCSHCGISNFYIQNDKGEKLNVKVTWQLEIIPADNSKSLDGFNLRKLYCLGCSWSGSVSQLKRYLI